ncbi:MAG: hypothetical protein ABJK64_14710 [Paraglaciecola sp.]|uniref:hypothetical protein n=1 Tax=Paraglaciecola sp. TaxID=1920173 RepID=UPI00329751FC
MNFRAFSIKRFLVLSLIFNLPPILAITKIGFLFLPLLFWANIPVFWTGVAESMGNTHFKIEALGALPQSVTAYLVVISFWLLIAGLVTVVTSKTKSE